MSSEQRETELVTAAREVMRNSYAPYSRFRVGAALAAADGRVYLGCNVENASFPAGLCAERSAVAAAVAAGTTRFDYLVLASDGDVPTPPCGICRQVLVEFEPSLPILSVANDGRSERWTLSELLAHPFTPRDLTPA
ncbi:MAG TPA: cytidine deaminase [Gemmatimonadaceae bacterium]|nr:cytidine deaminase [Gemmatimonadaceae bacterium]